MVYDDASKKWVPIKPGQQGFSRINIYHNTANNTFRVVGVKLQDQQVRPQCLVTSGNHVAFAATLQSFLLWRWWSTTPSWRVWSTIRPPRPSISGVMLARSMGWTLRVKRRPPLFLTPCCSPWTSSARPTAEVRVTVWKETRIYIYFYICHYNELSCRLFYIKCKI